MQWNAVDSDPNCLSHISLVEPTPCKKISGAPLPACTYAIDKPSEIAKDGAPYGLAEFATSTLLALRVVMGSAFRSWLRTERKGRVVSTRRTQFTCRILATKSRPRSLTTSTPPTRNSLTRR